jgi:acyl-coenzyme A synthetase/AMP-(fatty) acid ligase
MPAASGENQAPDADPRTIRARMPRRLPAAAVPARMVLVTGLPTEPDGKVDRLALDRAAEETGS